MKRIFTLLLAPLAMALPAAAADLTLPAIFADHMVLQRDEPVPVWGWAAPGTKVTAEFAGQKKVATATPDGRWQLSLDPLPASERPDTLVLRSDRGGDETRIQDVLVGEVWLGSGQSNMAMTVDRCRDAEQEAAASNLPSIRMFKEESGPADTPQTIGKGTWTICAPDTVGKYSATLFFLGRELHRALGIPVGLVNSSVGGTPIESWIDAGAQRRVPELAAALDRQTKTDSSFDPAATKARFEEQLARWRKTAAEARKQGKTPPRAPRDPLASRARKGNVGGLFNGKIAPLIPYAIRGAVWYQGEANAHPDKAHLYHRQLSLLVNDWRARWGKANLPFAWVQLPNFNREGPHWMLVREAMLDTLAIPHTGMAIAIDIGDPRDIHPKNKQEVGRRLSLWALGTVYGQRPPSISGPIPAGHEIRDGAVIVRFQHADGGLATRGAGEPQGFEIAGPDRAWKPATAKIDADRVTISNPDVKTPAAARYAWAPDPACNLINAAGLPASPFRTDRQD